MIKSITAVELDCDFCTKTFNQVTGLGACHAALEGDFVAEHDYLFQGSTANGWVFSSTSGASATPGAESLALDSGTNTDAQFSKSGLTIAGSTETIVRIIFARTANRTGSATWQGTIYYSTGGHGYSESYRNSFSDASIGGISVQDINMASLVAGGTDWTSNTITAIRFDFDNGLGSGDFAIYAVQIGHYASASEATGTDKCFNTRNTCQFRADFVNDPVTYRFAKPSAHLPQSDISYIAANIASINYSPGLLNPGRSLGQRSSLEVVFLDHPHPDTGTGFDPYLSDRAYNPYEQGTFWGKWRARQPFLRGRVARWKMGQLEDGFAGMTSRTFLMEGFNGPTIDGKFSIVAKDPLKQLDGDRAQAPALSEGSLTGSITSADRSLTVTSGTGSTDYDATGYASIGQKEIVKYYRAIAGIDANTLLLLHADGTNGATTQTDSSSSARTMTSVGSAPLSSAWSKWGDTSMSFNGTTQYWTAPDSADWTFSGAFTFDMWARFSSLSATRVLFSHQTDANNQYRCYVTTAGAITFEVKSASVNTVSMASSNGVIVVNTDYHIAVVRTGTTWYIFVDGVQVATTTDSDTIPNFTGTFRVGSDGAAANFMSGYIDEFRVSNVARWTSAFTPPTGPYASTTDTFAIDRAQFNTSAQSHDAGEAFQQCLYYQTEDASDILYDLLVNYAGVNAAYIDLPTWQGETTNYNRVLYTALIAIPTSVKALVNELIVVAGLSLWWDDINELIRLQVLRAISTDAISYGEHNMVRNSLQVVEQPEKRLSTVQVWFGQINPLKSLDKDNFLSSAVLVDAEAEEDYGDTALEVVYSRWIPFGGLDIAARVCALLLGRYRDAPARFKFRMHAYSSELPSLGQGVQISARNLQDALGALDIIPGQVVRIKPGEAEFEIEVEQQSFTSYDTSDLTTRRITVDVDSYNLNIRTLHDNLYPEPVGGETVLFTINAGVTIGSTSISTPALQVGTWPVGVTINIVWNGKVQGKGGNGGNGGTSSTDATDGQNGGTAFYTRYAVNIAYGAAAKVFGGGGGGGGGQRSIFLWGTYRGASGGGGAGTTIGVAGQISNDWGDATKGSDGTVDNGGVGGRDPDPHLWGGDGGDPGVNGGSAYDSSNPSNGGGVGGTAGKAIDGISYCTITSGTADSRGGEVN